MLFQLLTLSTHGMGAVLCCAVLCCAVLCCAVLCCAVLCCAVLCCAVLCCAVLYAAPADLSLLSSFPCTCAWNMSHACCCISRSSDSSFMLLLPLCLCLNQAFHQGCLLCQYNHDTRRRQAHWQNSGLTGRLQSRHTRLHTARCKRSPWALLCHCSIGTS